MTSVGGLGDLERAERELPMGEREVCTCPNGELAADEDGDDVGEVDKAGNMSEPELCAKAESEPIGETALRPAPVCVKKNESVVLVAENGEWGNTGDTGAERENPPYCCCCC